MDGKQIHDDDSEDEDNDNDGDCDNGCEVGRGVSLVKNRKEHVYILEGDTLRKKQKSIIVIAEVNEDGLFWNESAELWTNGNMKFFKREAIFSVNTKDHIK